MNFIKIKKIIFILILPLVLSACSLTVKTKPTASGGIFKTVDAAQTWENKSNVAHPEEGLMTIDSYNINYLVMDPTDSNTLYASTRENGLYVSWDGADSWRPLLTDRGQIIGLAINPSSPCNLYAITTKNVFKSLDCGRRWLDVFYEKRTNANITDIAIDFYNPNKIFLSFNTAKKGEIIWSQDSGTSWQVLKGDFRYAINRLFINPQDTRIMYAATEKELLKTSDQGASWENLTDNLKDQELKGGEVVSQIVFLPEFADGFVTVSKYGLLRSEDGGANWQAYILLQQPNTTNILSLVVNPNNTQELYYSTDKGIYKSVDNGGNWITLASPTTRWLKTMLIDPKQGNVLYLGTWQPAN